MNKRFLVLGGYGATGRLIAELLLAETAVSVTLAGRNLAKAQVLADALNGKFGTDRVSARRVDAADPQSLRAAFSQVDFVVVASSTAQYASQVAAAALDARIDYLDVQFSPAKMRVLEGLSQEIERAGCCFITEGGFHPGLPAALVRYAAAHYDRLDRANVASVIKVDWSELALSEATMQEMVSEIMDFEALSYQEGRWVQSSWTDYRSFDFDPPFDRQPCLPMLLEEMRPLPDLIPSLRETGFFVGGFNWFVDYVVMSIAWAGLKLWPQRAQAPVARLMSWGLRTFSKPPYGTVLLLEASGLQDGQPTAMRLTVSHADGYVLTAVPVVACLLQYLDGAIGQPGLWLQANVVEPDRLLRDMARMGVSVQIDAAPEPVERDAIDQRRKTMAQKKKWSELTPARRATIVVGGAIQFLLLIAALLDLRRRSPEQIRGGKRLWMGLVFINYVGPIAYFLFGRQD